MIHTILWTGGWDSTFRILDLTLNKNETVQPFYILDKSRPSTAMEIKTMDNIKEMIKNRNPNAVKNILETKYFNKEKIPENKVITNRYKALVTKSHLGEQYDWLGRFSESQNIYDLELCIHLDDKAHGFIKDDVEKIETENDSYYKMKKELSINEIDIFSYYHFPLLDMSKLNMEEVSRKSGFGDVMEQTWFCYKPNRDGTPCGFCNPCKYTKNEGLGRRVPDPTIIKRAQYDFNRVKRRIKKVIGS